jgi:hypothetical protein
MGLVGNDNRTSEPGEMMDENSVEVLEQYRAFLDEIIGRLTETQMKLKEASLRLAELEGWAEMDSFIRSRGQ